MAMDCPTAEGDNRLDPVLGDEEHVHSDNEVTGYPIGLTLSHLFS